MLAFIDKLRSRGRIALASPPRSLASDFGLASLIFIFGALAQLGLDFMSAGRFPYIAFFPALALTATLCTPRAAAAFIAASAFIGAFWSDAHGYQGADLRIAGAVVYALSASLIAVTADALKTALREIQARNAQMSAVNSELNHRIPNLLQIASVLIAQSIDSSVTSLKTAVSGRLSAIGNAQALLASTPRNIPLAQLIDVTVAPLAPARDRLIANGPPVILPAQPVTMLSLVLHELGTNALKYGAWSGSRGIVSIGWVTSGGKIAIDWRESDGPSVETPRRLGAGAKLIRAAIPDAAVDYRIEKEGVRCIIEMPLPG